jgi:CRP-like cAMP-binding protein
MSPVPTALAKNNHVLAMLPPAELERVSQLLQARDLKANESISEPGQAYAEILFPMTAVCSITVETESGGTVEAGITGADGVVGLPPFLGGTTSPRRTMCQIPGSTLFAPTTELLALDGDSAALATLARRYALTFLTQAAQAAACNRLHPLEQRAARWLLMADDRTPEPTFQLTQEFFAMMLGAHRPTVSLAAQMLQRAGVIAYRRGIVTIVDRAGLEEAACECYAVIRADYEMTMGRSVTGRMH